MVDDFHERIQPFLEANNADIEAMKNVHEEDRGDYAIRLEALRRAREDEAEIERTAMDSQGVYCFLTMNPEAIRNRLKLRTEHHYRQLKFGRVGREREEVEESQDCA